MQFRYRFVPFGTQFRPATGSRPHDCSDVQLLFENEIAADVGGTFWWDSTDTLIPVIDHHFSCDNQFPSAAAAVLHSADRVQAWANSVSRFEQVFLVTHEFPDFDAFASLYLIRSLATQPFGVSGLLLGMAPDSWRNLTASEVPPRGRVRIDWYRHAAVNMDETTKWRILIACLASMVDNCKPFPCGRQKSPPAVLYAALERKRHLQEEGARLFFDRIRDAIVLRDRNPLTDAIFQTDPEFAPEVELLEREEPAYQRDLKRARRVIVVVPTHSESFADYYSKRTNRKLLGPDGTLDPIHTETHGVPEVTDGIYLRDPESILFKDLVRLDLTNSSFGRGFTFSAIAYSNGRPYGHANQSDYFFALDPETAGRRTLYPLWARLEDAELRCMTTTDQAELVNLDARRGFSERAPNPPGLMHDPWFDAPNSGSTLVATPFRGTTIGPAGIRSDLSDDPVAQLVREQLELTVYAEPVKVVDYPADGEPSASFVPAGNGPVALPNPVAGYFRFCSVPLVENLDTRSAVLTQQIGDFLWSVLHGYPDRPTDFVERHLTRDHEIIAVWSRRGIAAAYLPSSAHRIESTEDQFQKLITLLGGLPSEASAKEQKSLDRAEDLLSQIATQRQKLSMPESVLAFRRFVDAIGFHETLGIIQDVLSARVARAAERQSHRIATATSASMVAIKEGQEKVEFLEILFVTLYSIEILHIVLGLIAENRLWEGRIACSWGLLIAVIVWRFLLAKDRNEEQEDNRAVWQPLQLVPALTVVVLTICLFLASVPPMTTRLQHLLNPQNIDGAPPVSEKAPKVDKIEAPPISTKSPTVKKPEAPPVSTNSPNIEKQ